jgi:hypothetical protein
MIAYLLRRVDVSIWYFISRVAVCRQIAVRCVLIGESDAPLLVPEDLRLIESSNLRGDFLLMSSVIVVVCTEDCR